MSIFSIVMRHLLFLLFIIQFIQAIQAEEFVEKKEKNFQFEIKTRIFAQGEVAFLKVKPKVKISSHVLVQWDKESFVLFKKKSQNFAFLAIPPDFKKKYITLTIRNKQLFPKYKSHRKSYKVSIKKTEFPFVKKKLIVQKKYVSSKLPKSTLKFIQECSKIKKRVFKTNSENKIFSSFHLPLKKVKINSHFYNYRLYNNRKKSRPHGGTDFKGKVGDPIYAINSGRVLIAQKMYYEGNFTVIDHGNSFFSLYMHQSKMFVKKNQFVKKGQLIGKVGSTGRVTGPHLHLGLKIGNSLVNPMSVLNIDFF